MTLLRELEGQTLGGEQRVRIDTAPVRVFATAVGDRDPVYRSDGAPVPATFPFVMPYWGSLGEGGAAGLPVDELRGPGRLLLHGEQAFTYHRWPQVGDDLVGTTRVVSVSEKVGPSATMHFYVTRTEWRDAGSGDPVVDSDFTLIVRIPTA